MPFTKGNNTMKKLLIILLLLPMIGFSLNSQLKAIIILGEGDNLSDKQEDITYMENIRLFLNEKNVLVKTFYDNEVKWEDIVEEAKDASILIYQGHGIEWKKGYGGFDLKKNVSSEDIVRDLKLKSNAVVLFQSVCGGAGSSAGDDIDIGLEEAKKRILSYSDPFFKIGAKAYFAINTKGGVMDFLISFFRSESIQQIFNKSLGSFYEKEIDIRYDKDKNIGIASRNWGGTTTRTTWFNGEKTTEEVPSIKNYSITYIGNPDYNINYIK